MKDLTRLVGEKAPQSMAVYGGDFELVFVDILFKYDLHSHFTYHTDDRHGHHTRCWPWWCSSRRTRAAGMLLVQKARPLRLPWVKPTRRTVQFLPQVWEEHSAHGPGRLLLQAEDEGGCTGAATGKGSPALRAQTGGSRLHIQQA
eukprot:scaffold1047_cov112-Isochrysis_galbana.AAC.1